MEPRKLNVMIAVPAYGGNGGVSSEFPKIRTWYGSVMYWCKTDPRVGEFMEYTLADTPIPMVRNRFVEMALKAGADVLVMCDSDMYPDPHIKGDATYGLPKVAGAKPFFESSFDFLYEHWERGPVFVAAPYCGPSPSNNIYVFRWTNKVNPNPNPNVRLRQYTREEAMVATGFEEVAALPTGLIMFDTRIFKLKRTELFYYEYKHDGANCELCGMRAPGVRAEKISTEDVASTRDLSLLGITKYGYNPCFINWDAWAGHVKPQVVGKPQCIDAHSVHAHLRKAWEDGITQDRLMDVGAGKREDNSRLRGVVVEPEPDEVVEPEPDEEEAVVERQPDDVDLKRVIERAVCRHGRNNGGQQD